MDALGSLTSRIANGDKQAEHALLNHFWRPLYSIVLFKCSDHALAQDIVQETFIVVIEKARASQIENPDAIASFVRRVAENLLIANYRKKTRHQTDTTEDMDALTNHMGNVEASISSEKLLDVVKQVLKEMKVERDRYLLSAYFFDGKSKEELCNSLALSSDHFDKVLHRAKSRLKQSLSIKYNIDLSKQSLLSLISIAWLMVCLNLNIFNIK